MKIRQDIYKGEGFCLIFGGEIKKKGLGETWQVMLHYVLLVTLLNADNHAVLHGQGKRDLVGDLLAWYQSKLVAFDHKDDSNEGFQGSQVLT